MNVSRFMNLAAIFSLDLESQYMLLSKWNTDTLGRLPWGMLAKSPGGPGGPTQLFLVPGW